MKKSVYFIIQTVWSLVLSTIIWYLTLVNSSFDFYGNSDDSIAGMIFVIGAVIYLILTIVQIGFGIKKVEGWRWWFMLISLLISAVVGFLGSFVAIWGSEYLNKLISLF